QAPVANIIGSRRGWTGRRGAVGIGSSEDETIVAFRAACVGKERQIAAAAKSVAIAVAERSSHPIRHGEAVRAKLQVGSHSQRDIIIIGTDGGGPTGIDG